MAFALIKGMLVSFFSIILSLTSATWIVPIRGNEEAATTLKKKIPGSKIVTQTSGEFGDGNTHAQITEKLSQARVLIPIATEMSPDQLMEVLIKIRIARYQNARQIVLLAPNGLGQTKVLNSKKEVMPLPLAQWLSVAGVHFVKEGNGIPQPLGIFPRQSSPIFPKEAYVVADRHPELGKGLAKKLGIKVISEASVDADRMGGNRLIYVVPAIKPLNENLFSSLAQIWSWSEEGFLVHLVSPYLFYARSDKIDLDGTTIVGKLIADLIKSVGTEAITFLRLHASQSQGFFDIPSTHISGRKTLVRYLKRKKTGVTVSPDAGFQKQATVYAKDLKTGVAVINKSRDPITGEIKIHGISGPPIKGRRPALIDDETQTGGTLDEGGNLLHQKKASAIFAAVTHLTGSAEKALSNPHITRFIFTNSLPVDPKIRRRATVLDISGEIADGIRAMVLPHTECIADLREISD